MKQPSTTMLIDVVDSADRPTGLTVRRDQVLHKRVGFRTVHVLVFNSGGDLLLQRLSPARDRHPDTWGSSVAGYLFAGEDYESAARRRIEQELGVSPALTWVGKIQMHDTEAEKFVGVFRTVSDGPFRPLTSQIAELGFFAPREIERAIWYGERDFTPTFLKIFDFYRSLQAHAAPSNLTPF